MRFPLERFNDFCSELTIDSKERGQLLLTQDNQLTTQKYFSREIARGLDDDIHFFVILKGRQEGITTICAAYGSCPGLDGLSDTLKVTCAPLIGLPEITLS